MIKKIIILKPKRALNFSESCNVGVKNSKNEKIVILNDDVIISKNTIEELAKNVDDNTVVGPDSNCNLGFQTDYAYTVKGIKLVPAMTLEQVREIIPDIYTIEVIRKEIISRDWLAFFAVMMTRKFFEDVGYMDENYIYDREDLDICIRAKEKGKKFHQIFSSYCFHFGGVSRKRKHQELGLKHDEDCKHNLEYFNSKWNKPLRGQTKDLVMIDDDSGFKDKPSFVIFTGFDSIFWDERALEQGIGGSETHTINIAREMAKLGYNVKVFNNCSNQHFDYKNDNVEYINHNNFLNYIKNNNIDFFVSSRWSYPFQYEIKAKLKFLLAHDVFIKGDKNNVFKDKVDKYLALSTEHKKYLSSYHNIPQEQILISANGLDLSRFSKKVKKNPHKLIYSSSLDRGFDVLALDIFPKLKKIDPKLKLYVFYGIEGWIEAIKWKKENNQLPDWEIELFDRVQKGLKQKDIIFKGKVDQQTLAKEYQSSSYWFFPTHFSETFCISALEAMASSLPIITSNYWGLRDTVKQSGILVPYDGSWFYNRSKEYLDKFLFESEKLLTDKEYYKEWSEKSFERITRFTWENVAFQFHTFFEKGIWNEIQ